MYDTSLYDTTIYHTTMYDTNMRDTCLTWSDFSRGIQTLDLKMGSYSPSVESCSYNCIKEAKIKKKIGNGQIEISKYERI